MKRQAALGFFGLFMAWTFMAEAAFARTGGRAGGSLKQAPMRMHSRPSPSRNYNNHYNHYNHYRPPSGRGIFAPPTRLYYHRGPPPSPVVITTGPQSQLFQPYGPPMKYRYRRRVSLTEIALATGTALFIVNGVSNRLQANGKQTNSSALGPGFTMAKVTVSLSVPDRDAPHSIFKALQTISSTARTDTRAGVQQLISNVALELLRQEKAIRSAESKSAHYKVGSDVERAFLRESISERSKFDRDVEYKDGAPAIPQQRQPDDSKATEAVVTILMATEGDSTRLPKITKRTDVLEALRKLAVDSQVDECLLSGEVVWSPELRSESLTMDEIYADYPSLFPL